MSKLKCGNRIYVTYFVSGNMFKHDQRVIFRKEAFFAHIDKIKCRFQGKIKRSQGQQTGLGGDQQIGTDLIMAVVTKVTRWSDDFCVVPERTTATYTI